jgi:cob(I)alamin adenosyltransferase
MKIYTRTGDDGTTMLLSGERVEKTHPRFAVCGTVDELNSALGVARAANPQADVDAQLEPVQRQLFQLGAALATTKGDGAFGRRESEWLEAQIDQMTSELPPLKNFILPGGTPAAAHIHMARAICRRCEREAWRVEGCEREITVYLNRLSDFLFTLARFENHLTGKGDVEWRP